MSDFTIVLPDVWELNKHYEAGFILNDPDTGLVGVEAAVWELESKYEFTHWYIKVDDKSYKFWIGNIAYIWEDILPWLEEIREGSETAQIANWAQGKEASIYVDPWGKDQLKVLIHNNGFIQEDISPDVLAEQKHIVDKERFISEWKMFVLKILMSIIKENFLGINDVSLKNTLSHVLRI